jgi:acyl-CoA hydrolase
MARRKEGQTMDLPESIRKKVLPAQEAVSIVAAGETVFVGTACATPRVLVSALESTHNLYDIKIFHFLTDGVIPLLKGVPKTKFKHSAFYIGNDMREAIKQGQSDYIPISIAQVPALMENGRISVDTALIQVSGPEGDGYVSLGISVDISKCAVRHARSFRGKRLFVIEEGEPGFAGKRSACEVDALEKTNHGRESNCVNISLRAPQKALQPDDV